MMRVTSHAASIRFDLTVAEPNVEGWLCHVRENLTPMQNRTKSICSLMGAAAILIAVPKTIQSKPAFTGQTSSFQPAAKIRPDQLTNLIGFIAQKPIAEIEHKILPNIPQPISCAAIDCTDKKETLAFLMSLYALIQDYSEKSINHKTDWPLSKRDYIMNRHHERLLHIHSAYDIVTKAFYASSPIQGGLLEAYMSSANRIYNSMNNDTLINNKNPL